MTATNDYRINWKRLAITQEGEGTVVHPLVALALTPIIGLAFLMFLPFIGFYLSIQALGLKLGALFAPHAAPVATGAAYLTGQEGSGNLKDPSSTLKVLQEDIERRRLSK